MGPGTMVESFTAQTSVITCDMNGIVQEYAADAAALFGWSQEEVLGKMSVAMFHVPKNVPTLVPRLLREAVEKGKFEEEVTLMRKDASTFRAVLTVRPMMRDGQQVGFMGMTHPLGPPGNIPVGRLWVQAFRAPFLLASLIPGVVAGLAAWQAGYAIDLPYLGLALLGLAFIHMGTNMANDAWDFRSGNDLAVRHLNPFAGGGRVLFRGVLDPKAHLAVAIAFLALGSVIGLYFVFRAIGWPAGAPLLVLGILGVTFSYFYVAPPFRLAHHGLGEIAVGLAFGPIAVLGTYFVLTRAFDPPAIVLSITFGLLVAGILWINEIPDIPADSSVGKRTVVVRLGADRAAKLFGGIVIAAYAVLLAGVLLVALTPWALLAFLALPLAVKPIVGARKAGGDPHALIPSNAGMILATIVTGILIAVGLVVEGLVAS